METILLAWNPNRYSWGDFQHELAKMRKIGRVADRWSVGSRNTLQSGSRFFLIRLGVEPRGLVGSGWTTTGAYAAEHWDPEKAARGETARYADISFDVLSETPIVTMDELSTPPYNETHWSTQMSGIRIADAVAKQLEIVWSQRTSNSDVFGREELKDVTASIQTNSSRVYVNRYERDPRARALCLGHHGMHCACCGVLLADVYGNAASNLIHVHHLTPLANLPDGIEIDPVRDLRPVCPNCHAVIHTTNPPLGIEEVKMMLAEARSKR